MTDTKRGPPIYNSYCFIYLNNKIIGFTNTSSEADSICSFNPNYQWDYNNVVKSKEERVNLYRTLPQLIYFKENIMKN